ncbi:hypothetical protein AVEN_71693-1 [Araneus ventricosus]|uniref:Uncharacterized protein n=1 Tax=Araneus ventricosus TaxID=182803 RepID=A0A4Y2FC80_ARAVE|nr:hypothetical protein AVEN_71693-1 [Araneus ventricosus]
MEVVVFMQEQCGIRDRKSGTEIDLKYPPLGAAHAIPPFFMGLRPIFGGGPYEPHHHYYTHQESETPLTYPAASPPRTLSAPSEGPRRVKWVSLVSPL